MRHTNGEFPHTQAPNAMISTVHRRESAGMAIASHMEGERSLQCVGELVMEQRLIDFIARARKKGLDYATLRVVLRSAGWKEKDVAEAMASEALDIEVPRPRGSGTAREAFLYLLQFTALYILVIGLVVLFFEYIDRLFVDPAQENWLYQEEYSRSTIRWWLATLIMTTPLFFWISAITNRDIRRFPERGRSAIRRWLTYLTLFVAAVTVLFDVIAVVYELLGGELTARTVAKAGILLVIVSTAFLYYLLSLRTPDEGSS